MTTEAPWAGRDILDRLRAATFDSVTAEDLADAVAEIERLRRMAKLTDIVADDTAKDLDALETRAERAEARVADITGLARDDLPNEIGRAIIAQNNRYDGEADAVIPIIERRINQALEWAAGKCREEVRFQHEMAGRYSANSPARWKYRHAATRVSEVEKVIQLAISEAYRDGGVALGG